MDTGDHPNPKLTARRVRSQLCTSAVRQRLQPDGLSGASIGVLSRRTLVGYGAGLASVFGLMELAPVGRSVAKRWRIEHSERAFTIYADNIAQWTVEVKRFAGSPELSVARLKDRLTIRLKGSRFPGTWLSGDFIASIWTKGGTDFIRMEHAGCGLDAEAPLFAWLAGEALLEGNVQTKVWRFGRAAFADVGLDKATSAYYTHDGTLVFSGPSALSTTFCGEEILADKVEIGVADSSDQSLLMLPAKRRTKIEFEASGGALDGKFKGLALAPVLELDLSGHRLSDGMLELSESARGEVRGVMVASAKPASCRVAKLALKTSADLKPTITLGLNAIQLVDTRGKRKEAVVLASIEPHDEPLAVGPYRLHVGRSEAAYDLHITSTDGGTTLRRCRPRIVGLSGGMSDAVLLDRALAEPIEIDLTVDGLTTGSESNAKGRLWLEEGFARLSIPAPSRTVVRPTDLALFHIEFRNLLLEVDRDGNTWLTPEPGKEPAIAMQLPPQALTEEAYSSVSQFDPRRASDHRLSGNTLLVVRPRIPECGLSLTLANLLRACSGANILVRPNALPRSGPDCVRQLDKNDRPSFDPAFTMIEAPGRIFLSPNKHATWLHPAQPVVHRFKLSNSSPIKPAWTEVWNTRLAVKSDNGTSTDAHKLRTLRAVWSADFESPLPQDKPFRQPLQGLDRQNIVRLTFDFFDSTGKYPDKPIDRLARAIDAGTFVLTSLGASLHLSYDAPLPVKTADPSPDLLKWVHRMSSGRDEYVLTQNAGYLFPFGHKVSKVSITRRAFVSPPNANPPRPVSILIKEEFLSIDRPDQDFREVTGMPHEGRAMLRSLSLRDRGLIPIAPATLIEPPDVKVATDSFWIDARTGGRLRLNASGIDAAGRTSSFTVAGIFVPAHILDSPSAQSKPIIETLREVYEGTSGSARVSELKYQEVAFTRDRENEAASRNSHLSVASLTFGVTTGNSGFFPHIELAVVRLTGASRLGASGEEFPIRYATEYLEKEFVDNPGELYAELPVPIEFDFKQLAQEGSIFSPRVGVIGLSRLTGIAPGPATATEDERKAVLKRFAQGYFAPKSSFTRSLILNSQEASRLLPEEVNFLADLRKTFVLSYAGTPDDQRIEIGWHPLLQWESDQAPESQLEFSASARTGGADTKFSFTSNITNVSLGAGSVIATWAKIGISPELPAALIVFGALAVNPSALFAAACFALIWWLLNRLVSTGLWKKLETEITRSISIRVPNLDLGIGSLHDFSVTIILRFGLLGQPMASEFKIAEIALPAVATLGPFYGRGYFVLRNDTFCLASCEMAIKLGVHLEPSFFDVVSATLDASVGFYLQLNTTNLVVFKGEVHLSCSFSILGHRVLSASVDAAVTVVDSNVSFHAVFRVELDLWLFSFGEDVPIDFSFGHIPSSIDPRSPFASVPALGERAMTFSNLTSSQERFEDLFSDKDWDAYCDAFACTIQ